MDRSVVVVTIKLVWYLYPEESVIACKLRFEIVCNSHFYNYSMDRSVVVPTVKLGVMSLPCILGTKSYCW